jgi:hypothetical protein
LCLSHHTTKQRRVVNHPAYQIGKDFVSVQLLVTKQHKIQLFIDNTVDIFYIYAIVSM